MDNGKRIKQDCDISSLCRGNKNISIANDSSRQGVFTESIVTFDNSFCEDDSSINAIATQSNQGKPSLSFGVEETALSVLGKLQLPTFVDQRYNNRTLLSPSLAEIEKPPVLRKIRSRGAESTDGFALDHGRYPKLVGVQSISSKSRISSELSSLPRSRFLDVTQRSFGGRLRDIQETAARETSELSRSVQSLKEFQHGKHLYSQVGAQPVANTSLTSLLPATPINCKSALELVLNVNQKNGKSDMSLVKQDKVSLVQRYDLDGESFLIHTDNTGKASILAKFRFPTFVKGKSSTNTGETRYPKDKGPLRTPCKTNNTLLSVLKSANQQQSYQRTTVTPVTKDTVSMKPVERDLLQIPVLGKTHNRTLITGECSMRQTSSEITRLLQGEGNRTPVGHSKSQALNETDNTPRCPPSDLQSQRIHDMNSLGKENPRLNQSQQPFKKPRNVAFREPQLDPQVQLNETQRGNEISRDTVQRLVTTSHVKKLEIHKTSLESMQNLRSNQPHSNQSTRYLSNGERVAFTACTPHSPPCYSVDELANVGSKTGKSDSLSSSFNSFPAQTERIGHSRNRTTVKGKDLLDHSQPHPSFTSDPVENKRTDATKTILRLLDSWKKRLYSQNDSLQIKHLLVGSSLQELSANKNTAALRASEIDSCSMGKRVLNNASDSITSNANVLQTEKANGQTDSYCPFYVEETSLTKHQKRHVDGTDTQTNDAITTLNESLSQSACYVPISSPLSLSLVGRGCSQICSTKRKNTLTFLRNGAERSYNSEAPSEQTPTYHNRYGPHSNMKEVKRRNSPRYMGSEAPTRSQQRKNEGWRINTKANEIVEIVIDPTTGPVNQIQTTGLNSENIREDTLLRGQRSNTGPLSQRTLHTSVTCDNNDDDDDDVVEVIIPKPKRHCPLRISLDSDSVNETTATSGHDNFGNDELTTKQTVPRETVETVNVVTEHNFRSEMTKKKYEALETNQMHGVEEGEIQSSETDEAIEEQTQLDRNEHGLLHKTIVSRESRAEDDSEVTFSSSVNDYSYHTVSDTSRATDVGEGNDSKREISLLVQNDCGEDGVNSAQNAGKDAVCLKVEHNHKQEKAVLKTARDQLEKKIRKTRLRIVQEDINWKKKYLQKLETLLEKKLTKLGGESSINDDLGV